MVVLVSVVFVENVFCKLKKWGCHYLAKRVSISLETVGIEDLFKYGHKAIFSLRFLAVLMSQHSFGPEFLDFFGFFGLRHRVLYFFVKIVIVFNKVTS